VEFNESLNQTQRAYLGEFFQPVTYFILVAQMGSNDLYTESDPRRRAEPLGAYEPFKPHWVGEREDMGARQIRRSAQTAS
jgi:hypothetical protein